MTETPMMIGERPKLKEVSLPLDTVKELADLIPKPEDQYHYRVTGTWKPNQEVFQVNEGDGVVSDYLFPEKADMSTVQFASRKTYVKELNMWGNMKDKKVQFDRSTGKWKKLTAFQTISGIFHKAENIPATVVEENDGFVLHTLEAKRPVGKTVKEAEFTTLQDAKVDLGLKYKHMEYEIRSLRKANRDLEIEKASLEATNKSLYAQMLAANINSFGQNMNQNNSREWNIGSNSNEPPTYGNITPVQETRKTKKPPEPVKPLTRKEKQTSDDIIAQFEKNKQANEAKLDEEYKKWIANHPDKAYYELSGEPYPTKAEYVEMKGKEAAAKKAGRDANERGLAKD